MGWEWEGCWGARPATQSADRLGKWSLETHPVLPTTPSCLFVAIIFGFLAPHSSSSLEYGSQASLSSHSHCCPVWPGWHSSVLEFLCKSSTGLLPRVNSRDPQLLSFLGCTLSPTASQARPLLETKTPWRDRLVTITCFLAPPPLDFYTTETLTSGRGPTPFGVPPVSSLTQSARPLLAQVRPLSAHVSLDSLTPSFSVPPRLLSGAENPPFGLTR